MDHAQAQRRLALGKAGEDRAALWYIEHGYRIVERNWRGRHGEIDLILSAPRDVVFCEVKTRRTDRMGHPAEAVTRSKQLQVRRLAAEYLHRHSCGGHGVRFDVATVLNGQIDVIQGAF
jgi:putative endonuclease